MQGVVGGCAEMGEDKHCRKDERSRQGGGVETRSTGRLRRLSEDNE